MITIDQLPLPVSDKMRELLLSKMEEEHKLKNMVTLNFRDPNYGPITGGFHPVEICLEKNNNIFEILYITDFGFVGSGNYAELVKVADFDFVGKIFKGAHGCYPIEQSIDYYQIWERNFISYATQLNVFNLTITASTD